MEKTEERTQGTSPSQRFPSQMPTCDHEHLYALASIHGDMRTHTHMYTGVKHTRAFECTLHCSHLSLSASRAL